MHNAVRHKSFPPEATSVTPLLLTFLALLALALLLFCIDPLAILPLLERLTPNPTYRVRARSRKAATLSTTNTATYRDRGNF